MMWVTCYGGGCPACDDLSPIERELVAQARLMRDAKYEFSNLMFADRVDIEIAKRIVSSGDF